MVSKMFEMVPKSSKWFRKVRNDSEISKWFLFGIVSRHNEYRNFFTIGGPYAAHSVYEIYSVLKLFEIAVCSAHFDFFDISTPVMRIMLTMANRAK